MQRELGPLAEEQALQRKREQLAEEALAQFRGVPRRELRLRRPGAHQVRGAARRQGAADRARAAARRPRCARSPRCRPSAASCRCAPARAQGEIERDLAVVAQHRRRTPPGSGSWFARRRTARSRPWSPRPGRAWPPPAPWRAWSRPTRACRRSCSRRRARSASSGPTRRCMLRYQAFPYQKFGHQSGQVVQVSKRAAAAFGAGRHAAGRRDGVAASRSTASRCALDQQDVAAYGATQAAGAGHAARRRRRCSTAAA